MKQLVLRSPYEFSLTETDIPGRPRGHVLLRTLCAGICGSDLHAYRGNQPFLTYPRVLGHELALEVVEADAGTDLKPGDKVTVEPYIGCGRCYPCSRGRYNCCERLEVLGVHRDGGFQEYITVPEEKVYKAPESMDVEELALIEPLSIGAHSVERARVEAGEFVFVIGAGPIGIAAAQVAKSRGATVAIGDIVEERLQLALRLGADHACNFSKENVMEKMADLTGSTGAHVVIEAVGRKETIEETVNYVAPSGRIVIVGVGRDVVCFPQQVFNKKEIDFLGSRNSKGMFAKLIPLVSSGKLTMKPLVTHRITLEEVPEMFQLMDSNPGGVMKVLVTLG